MAVEYDNGGGAAASYASTRAVTLTVGSNTNRVMIAFSMAYDDTAFATGVADNLGHNYTLLNQTDDGGAGYGLAMSIWYLVNPDTGSQTVTATWSATGWRLLHVFSLYNVSQSNPVSGYQGQFLQNNSTNTKTIVSSLNSMIAVATLVYGSETISEYGSQSARTTAGTQSKGSTNTGDSTVVAGYTYSGSATADTIMAACSVNTDIIPSVPMDMRRRQLRPAMFKPGMAR